MSLGAYAPRPLTLGQRVILSEEDAGAWEVVRVGQFSATVKRRGKRVKVTVPKRSKDGEEEFRTFEAWEGGGLLTVSVNSFVWAAPAAKEEEINAE